MRDASQLKKENAEVYYRDKVGDRYAYVKGIVLEHKTVQDATKQWQQVWKRNAGTILKIAPKDTRTEKIIRYRHMSSVLTPEQYKRRSRGDTTKTSKPRDKKGAVRVTSKSRTGSRGSERASTKRRTPTSS